MIKCIVGGASLLLVSVLTAGCASSSSPTAGEEADESLASAVTASFTTLERRGFCNNSVSCWSSCSSTAYNSNNCGTKLNGAPAPTLTTTWSYPTSIGGSSSDGKMYIGHTTTGGYGDAYWFTQLGSGYTSNIGHFVYSTDLYVANADHTYQAVEWDGNWFYGGYHYIFGLQNDRRGSNAWRYFVPNVGWKSTNVPSSDLSGGWHHVTATFTRSGTNTVHLYSFQIDSGPVHFGNGAWTYNAPSSSGNKATFGLQGDEYNTTMSVYYRNVNVSLY